MGCSAKIIIAGSRDFDDYLYLEEVMDRLTQNLDHNDIEIVCGGARGADSLGDRYAEDKEYPIKYFYPDWDSNGKAAGHIRNRQMGDYSTHLVAFWDGVSKGTLGMIKYAKKRGLKVRVIRYD